MTLVQTGQKQNFNNKTKILINKDIVDIIMLLWNFDENKINTNNYFYYKINNIELRNYDNIYLKNKYVMLMAIYFFSNINKDRYSKQIISFDKIKKFFNITNKNFSYTKCLNSMKLLSKLNIILNEKQYQLIKIDNDNIVYFDKWIECIEINNFIEVNLDYNIFIEGNQNNLECMPLPYILINNYYNGIYTYQVYDLFSDIFNSKKIIRKRFILNILEKINYILNKNNIYLDFNCDFTPEKFKQGICIVSNNNIIEEQILPIYSLVKFDKNRNISKTIYFKENEYFISNFGILYRKTKQLADRENLNGYIVNNLKDINGKYVPFLRHQIVAQVFLWDKYDNNTTIDHIDRNRNNNKVDNLRWATSQEQAENRYIP